MIVSDDDTTQSLGIVVSWSCNETIFLEAQLRELHVCTCATHIVYSIGSHLFDGTPQNVPDGLSQAESQSQKTRIEVVRYDVAHQDAIMDPRKYHNLARLNGYRQLVKNNAENSSGVSWVMFLDGDEIPVGAELNNWFQIHKKHLNEKMAYKFSCYWYFKSPTWRARAHEDSIILVNLKQETAALTDPRERDGIVAHQPGGCMRRLCGVNSEPMFHPFSWVRPLEQIRHKVRTWGHKNDRTDWNDIIHQFWIDSNHDRQTTDPIHGYKYDILESPMFDIRV